MTEAATRTPASFDDHTDEIHVYNRDMAISGAPKIPYPGRRGAMFIIEGARASWTHGQDIRHIEVRGTIRDAENRRGEDVTFRYMTPAVEGARAAAEDMAPAWLLDLFASPSPAPAQD